MVGYITGVAGSVLVLLALLAHIELWQRKEYRWDRFWAYFTSPERARSASLAEGGSVVALIVAWVLYVTGASAVAEIVAGFAALLIATYHVVRTLRRGLFRPVFTFKAKLVVVTGLVCIGLLAALLYGQEFPTLLVWGTSLVLVPLLAPLAVATVNITTNFRKRGIINAAQEKRRLLTNLHVVGITGSFGKTSTKSFLQQILTAAGKRVLATDEHRNSPLPVAQDMLARLTPETDIYIVEMGAYRAGEIAELAQLTRPHVGVITAIGNQHIGLFGSLEKLAAAKWELIEGLPPDGVAVLNASDPVQQEKKSTAKSRVVEFSTDQKADVWASDVKLEDRVISATLHIDADMAPVQIPLLGQGALASVLAAAAAAHALHIPAADIFSALATVKGMPRTMEYVKNPRGTEIIDDSYSANEQGVMQAIEQLHRFPNPHKVIVFVPLIELGREGAAVHERLGQALRDSDVEVLVYGKAFHQQLQLPFITDPKELQRRLDAIITPESLLLLEGRLPDIVRQCVIS